MVSRLKKSTRGAHAAVSRREAGASRWRLRVLGALLLAAGLSAGAAATWSHLHTYLRGCDRFRLAALEVRGRRLLQGADVLSASGLKLGDSIYCIDLDHVVARLDSVVWIRRSRVERKPPDRLVVSVEERQRLAWIELGDEVFGIDAEGVLLPGEPHPLEDREDLDLPVIRGITWSPAPIEGQAYPGPRTGDAIVDSALCRIIDWWQEARARQPGICSSISEIEPLDEGSLRLFLVGDGLEIRVPIADLARSLTVLERLLLRIYRECPDPAYVDLRYDDQAVVGRHRDPGRSARRGGRTPSHG